MADLDAAIRAKFPTATAETRDLAAPYNMIRAALLDVLDVHKRNDRGCCAFCRESGIAWEGPVPYPCPTVKAIAKALGVEAS